jgi:hypothetical protein
MPCSLNRKSNHFQTTYTQTLPPSQVPEVACIIDEPLPYNIMQPTTHIHLNYHLKKKKKNAQPCENIQAHSTQNGPLQIISLVSSHGDSNLARHPFFWGLLINSDIAGILGRSAIIDIPIKVSTISPISLLFGGLFIS